ncbi:MAG: histidine phosphatase family protein [Clostridia bacterium]|nr:histidine phosphatase family protein [Clostridia bacterium]
MTTLILVRHGESTANREGIFAGHFDAELQDRGLLQAKETAKYIAENYHVDKVYASDLKRAFNTGRCIAELAGVEIIPDKNLREINAGKWDGVKWAVVEKLYEKDFGVWTADIGRAKTTDGESVAELAERVIRKLEWIAKENDGKTIVVATHATPIRAVQSMVKTGGLEEMKNIPWVSNASVSILEYDDGKWRFKLVGEDRHLGGIATHLPPNA